jgi:polysaccharide deacetylase family protein (PEP-CTERM system associated)
VHRIFLTIDIEDWRQSTLDHDAPISERVVSNTRRLLDLCAETHARGTFFFLGLVAEKYPGLVREVDQRGHEVASHGWAHQAVYTLGPRAFREDLRRSMAAIQEALGKKVLGYRAPDFSITEESFWAFEILAEEGLSYDSSIFPFRGPRYGIPRAFRRPHTVRCAANPGFVEFPLATVERLSVRLPVAGGGYFRLLPYRVTRAALRAIARGGVPPVCYFHPYELDASEFHGGAGVPWAMRMTQGLGRRRVPARLGRLLRDFASHPLRDALGDPGLVRGRTLDLTPPSPGGPVWRDD